MTTVLGVDVKVGEPTMIGGLGVFPPFRDLGRVQLGHLDQTRIECLRGRVWREVERQSARYEAYSATDAMEEVFDAVEYASTVELEDIEAQPDQTGVAFTIHGEVVGLDLFHRPSSLEQYLSAIVAGYAIDAVGDGDERSVAATAVERFLDQVAHTDREVHPGVGLGDELMLKGRSTGVGLSYEDILLHLAAFTTRSVSD